MATKPWTDPIVDEVHEWRQQLLDEADGDIRKLVKKLIASQELRGERLVNRQQVSDEELRKRLRKNFGDLFDGEHE